MATKRLTGSNWILFHAVLVSLSAIAMIICNVIAKEGWDIFPITMIGWWICSLYLPKYSTTPLRASLILVFFIFLDGLTDSLSTGMWSWIGPPWLLRYNYFLYPVTEPTTHPITGIYLVTFWMIAIPCRSLAIGAHYVASHFDIEFDEGTKRFRRFLDEERRRVILFYLTGWAIVMSLVCDWINFAIRPEVPVFDLYVPPLGFWTLERTAARTAVFLIVGAYCLHAAIREKRTRDSSVLAATALVLILIALTFLVALI
jgi:hypothetical protein